MDVLSLPDLMWLLLLLPFLLGSVNAVSGYGTLLQRGDGATPENFATVAEVGSISGPNWAVEMFDTTSHSDAASGNFRTRKPSLIDPGDLSFDIWYIPGDAGHEALRTDMFNRTIRNWRLIDPNASQTANLVGFISEMGHEWPTDEKITRSISITLIGEPTFS